MVKLIVHTIIFMKMVTKNQKLIRMKVIEMEKPSFIMKMET